MAKRQVPDDFDDDSGSEEYDGELDDELAAELDAALENDLDAALTGADRSNFADDDFDAEFADEEEDDDEDLSELDAEDLAVLLADEFGDDGFRMLNLRDLAAKGDAGLDDDIVELDLTDAPMPTQSLEEVLDQLVKGSSELPTADLMVFSDLTSSQVDQVRVAWPRVPLDLRRAVLEMLLLAEEEWLEMQIDAFLLVAVDDPDPEARRLAVEGFSDSTDAAVLGPLVHLLETDPDVDVRAAAAGALGDFVLAGELDELEPALAMRAEQSLLAVLANPAEPVAIQRRALESIAYSGEMGIRQLIEDAYYSPHEDLRLSAVKAMGRSADIHWRRLARAELRSPSPAMRAEAAYAAGELEARAALSDLMDLLDDPDERVRLAAIFALGRLGGREAQLALQDLAASERELEALAAEQALEEMAFYAGDDAERTPLYEEEDEEEDHDEDDIWEFDRSDDEDLGDYAP